MSLHTPEDTPDPQSPMSGPVTPPAASQQTGWGRKTGPLSRGGQTAAELPDFSRYSEAPRYDMSTFAEMVNVRAVTLWSWEQNLGLRTRTGDQPTGSRYSERDLLAYSWLRDQIIAGIDPIFAAQRLRDALTAARGEKPATPPATPITPPPARPQGSRLTGYPLSQTPSMALPPNPTPPSMPYTSGMNQAGIPYMPGATPSNLPLTSGTNPPSRPYNQGGAYPPSVPYSAEANASSQPYNASNQPYGPPSQPYNPPSQPYNPQGQQMARGMNTPSQPISRIGAIYQVPESVPYSQPHQRLGGEGIQGVNQARAGYAPKRDLGPLIQPLMQGFASLNTASVMQILDDALMTRSVETTCMTLIVPVLARINEMWLRKDRYQPEAIFALNMLKSRLFRLFDVLHEHRDAPLTFVVAGPDDRHELDALILALFWRRAGLRVVYFGQDVDSTPLSERVQNYHPRVVAVTLTSASRLRLIGHFAADIQRLPAPRAVVGFVGPLLARQPDLQRRIGGVFLGADPGQATQQVRNILHLREANG